MTKIESGQAGERRVKKHLWFGYGNYGGLPNLQVGGGFVRDPGLFEALTGSPGKARSPLQSLLYAAGILIGVMLLVMLAAWAITLFLR